MTNSADPRPALWVGHIVLPTTDVARAHEFWERAGMRTIESHESVAILELRGGTHLILLASNDPIEPGRPAAFDLMVDDVELAWKRYQEAGLAPSEVRRGKIHDSFTLTDPSGHAVTVNSSHASDLPV